MGSETLNRPWQYRIGMIFLAAAFAAAGSAYAQQLPLPTNDDELLVEEPEEEIRRYSVEIIVFRNAGSGSSDNEIFAPDPPLERLPADDILFGGDGREGDDDQSVVEYGDFVDTPGEPEELDLNVELTEVVSLTGVDFRRLEAEELTMAGIHRKLVLLDAYEPVLWGGWSQAVVDESLTPPVQLRIIGSPPLSINGSLTLYLKNYLHLVVDLAMQKTTPGVDPVFATEPVQADSRYGDERTGTDYGYVDQSLQTTRFQITEDRIFRSGELRYYDHPKFGVLARINRVEEVIEEESEDDPSNKPTMLSTTAAQ